MIFKLALIYQKLSQQELDDLGTDFLPCKKEGMLPDTFSRDVPYYDDCTCPLVIKSVATFPKFLRQFKRASDQAHWVYCLGSMNSEAVLLIIILKPESHKMTRDNIHVYMIIMMAEEFRIKY